MSAAKTLASIAAPAPQVAEEPTVQVKQQSAKQKARIDKGLPETLVESVRVDGLVSYTTFRDCESVSGVRRHDSRRVEGVIH
jgi:hypothetical protein